MRLTDILDINSGGANSGNFGHAGRPGQVGGSQPNGGGVDWRVASKASKGKLKRWEIRYRDTNGVGHSIELRLVKRELDGKTISREWEVYKDGIKRFNAKHFANGKAAKKAVEKRWPEVKKAAWSVLPPVWPNNPKVDQAEIDKAGKNLRDAIAREAAKKAAPLPRENFSDKAQLDNNSPLATSPVKKQSGLGGGVNGTYIVEMEGGLKGVWKPKDEESKMFPELVGSMYRREALGYDIAKLVGYEDLVPETVVREIDGKVGSVMKFVDNAQTAGEKFGYAAYSRIWDVGDRDQIERAAAFDYIVGNSDRHSGNYMVTRKEGEKYKFHLIDNGFSMYPEGNRGQSFGKRSHFFQAIRNHSVSISQSVKTAWNQNWDKIEAAMRARGIKDKEIRNAQRRLVNLITKENWSRL